MKFKDLFFRLFISKKKKHTKQYILFILYAFVSEQSLVAFWNLKFNNFDC